MKNMAIFGKEAETFDTLLDPETNRRIQGSGPFFFKYAGSNSGFGGQSADRLCPVFFSWRTRQNFPLFFLSYFVLIAVFGMALIPGIKKGLFFAADCLSPVCPGHCPAIKFMPECRSKDKTGLLHPNGQKRLSRGKASARGFPIRKSPVYACDRQ